MIDRLKFIENRLKIATEAGVKSFRVISSFINSAEMPDNVRKELQETMEQLRMGISERSMVKIQAAKDRLQPLLKAYAKIVASDKAKENKK